MTQYANLAALTGMPGMAGLSGMTSLQGMSGLGGPAGLGGMGSLGPIAGMQPGAGAEAQAAAGLGGCLSTGFQTAASGGLGGMQPLGMGALQAQAMGGGSGAAAAPASAPRTHGGQQGSSRSAAPSAAISASGWLGHGQPLSTPRPTGSSAPEPAPSPPEEESEEKRKLVEKVKKVQRTSEQNKAQWYTFCHMRGNWNYDPTRHSEASLQDFLNTLNTPELRRGPLKDIGEGESQQALAQYVKQVQRSGFKESWYAFCMWFQMSMDYDPSHYEPEFLRCFLNCVVAAQLPRSELDDGPSESKTAVVNQIKEIQKAGFREHWCAFNMMFKWSSDLDPMRHQERFLKKFVEAVELAAPIFGISLGEESSSSGYGWRSWDESDITDQIFVGGLPKTGADQEAITAHFSHFGPVRDVTLKYHENGSFRGFGFITFESKDTAKAVLKNPEGNSFRGKRLNCQPAAGKGAGGVCGSGGKGPGKQGGCGGWAGGLDVMGWGCGGCSGWGCGDWGRGAWGFGDWGGGGGEWDMSGWGGWDPMQMMASMGMLGGVGSKGKMSDKGKGKGKGKPKGKDDWFAAFAGPCWGGKGDYGPMGGMGMGMGTGMGMGMGMGMDMGMMYGMGGCMGAGMGGGGVRFSPF